MKLILGIVIAVMPLFMLAACGQGSGPTPASSAQATPPAPNEAAANCWADFLLGRRKEPL
jgi:hypothetical protein